MAEILFSEISVVPPEIQHDIDMAKRMKQRTTYVKAGWRSGLVHEVKIALRRMERVAGAFPEGSSVNIRYTEDAIHLKQDMVQLFGEYWHCT